MSKAKIFVSDSLNPYLNLATEEWIFHNLDPSAQVLFLWRNEETVVIGRNQNPWTECNLAQMSADKVKLARRTTGGGAVYHDLGNTNFTFLSPKDAYKKENNIKIIIEALKDFGIHGEASGRNDLLIQLEDGPRKFSGSAYREKSDRAFHHGTLLLHADLSRLVNYLTPNPKKLKAKGTESVRSRVINLCDVASDHIEKLDHQVIIDSLSRSFERFYGASAEVEHLNMESLQDIPDLRMQFDNLSSWDWMYGKTSEFNLQLDAYFTMGYFDFHFKVDECIIKEIQIFTDCLYPQLVEVMTQKMRGQLFTAVSMQRIYEGIQKEFPDHHMGLQEIKNWLYSEIEI